MPSEQQTMNLQLRSLLRQTGELELSLKPVPVPELASDEVLVRIEAAPINPSDLGLLLPDVDLATLRSVGTTKSPIVTAKVHDARLANLSSRFGESLPVGNEGAGSVVATGAGDAARALFGKTVAIFGGAMFAQYRAIKAAECLVLPRDTSAADGASAFVNPMTALAMVGTMRRDGYTALVHTAAASNLGQMLNRLCLVDGIGLVNVVRSQAQADILRAGRAHYICDSSAPAFIDDLTNAVAATGAMLAFDAIGGGKLVSQILLCMEMAARRSSKSYSRYGSSVHKHAYIYGGLNTAPTELARDFGVAWSIGGWLLTDYLQASEAAEVDALRNRVAGSLKSVFASRYTREISLIDVLGLDNIRAYIRRATGEKYLVRPHADT